MDARAVKKTILDRLRHHRLIPADENIPSTLSRAVAKRFASRKLAAQVLQSPQGVYGWFPIPGPYTSRYLWVQVVASVSEEPIGDRPREKVNLTLRGETKNSDRNASSLGTDNEIVFDFHGRGAWSEKRERAGALGGIEAGSSKSHEKGVQSATKDIFRSAPKRSHEFQHGVDFVIYLAATSDMPQPLRYLTDAARNQFFVPFEALIYEWANWNRPDSESDSVPLLYDWTEEHAAEGAVRLIVPHYLTRDENEPPATWQKVVPPAPGEASAPAEGQAVAVPAKDPEGQPVVRWADPEPSRPELNKELIEDRQLFPRDISRISQAIQQWAELTTLPPGRRPRLDATGEAAWQPSRIDPGNPVSQLVTHYASVTLLRANVDALLRHSYRIANTGITVGIDLNGAEYLTARGEPVSHKQKARRYLQDEAAPVNTSNSSRERVGRSDRRAVARTKNSGLWATAGRAAADPPAGAPTTLPRWVRSSSVIKKVTRSFTTTATAPLW